LVKRLGESISTWRRLLGLRGEQVAERANISLATYSKLENGHIGVSAGKVLAVDPEFPLQSGAWPAVYGLPGRYVTQTWVRGRNS
jgi:transcriptional regulator with XRE-family HTH domain